MNIQDKRLELIQRQASLSQEIKTIQGEIKILRCLQKNAAKEITEIHTELEKLEDNHTITLNCVNGYV